MQAELTLEVFFNIYSNIIKPLLKLEVNDETFFTLPSLYYQIYCYSLLYAVKILYVVTDGDTTRNMNIHKCLHILCDKRTSKYSLLV